MRLHLDDLLDRPISTITPPNIRNWHAKALRGSGGRTSISQSYRFIRAVFTVAVQDGAIMRNPCQIPGAGAQKSPERGIATRTPEDPNTPELIAEIAALAPDFLFSFYYRHMLSPAVLATARRWRADRLGAARSLARRLQAVVVLKGAGSVTPCFSKDARASRTASSTSSKPSTPP